MASLANAQLCEQIHDDQWAKSARFLKIKDPLATTGKTTHLTPGMELPVYHWQSHAAYTIATFDGDPL